MASLYELTNEEESLIEMFENGDIDEQTLIDTVESLDIGSKIEGCCKVIRQLNADAEAFKNEKDFFAKKEKSAKAGIERLKNSITSYMLLTEKDSVETDLFKVKKSKSERVEITDESKIECLYLIDQAPKIDKIAIKQAIKDGEEVAGAELTTHYSCNIK